MIGEETGEKSCKLPQNLTCQEDYFIFFLKIFHGFKNIHYICTQISDHWLKVVQTGRGYKKKREGLDSAGLPMPIVENFCGGVRVTFQRM